MWKETVKVLTMIVSEDDERVEAWYLLAFSLFRLDKYKNAKECCENVRNCILKLKMSDPELEAGTLEIYESVQKKLASKNKDG